MKLREVDLNLLVTLRELLSERHVTRAAEKLGVTQPAMSAALARMRVLFNDPLLVRTSRGMSLTAKAEQLLGQLDRTLLDIENMLERSSLDFNPATSRRTFTIIGTDFVEQFLLPRLSLELARQAPGVRIVFKPPIARMESWMSDGDIDLAIGFIPSAAQNLRTRVMIEDRYVSIARADHPRLRDGGLTLDAFAELPHVQVLPFGANMYSTPIDLALHEQGRVREVELRMPSFVPLLSVVAATDMISTVPARLARFGAVILPLAVFEPPVALPKIVLSLYWHVRSHADDGHKWLREFLIRLSRDLV
ncbi:LysR family transcriptional regulator [Paraburkholderia unamae]|uniref:LysR family transcriptional regulator n=1 Tax=Paraburkholderia unamae TaxID=219649 RepID=UPI000DC561CA|nr:LysR family transcriptional regulator [Paraburkholderia unamae]RAR54559.1 LysR family transcriptional regulator [Paraburkholderia unamae]